MMLHSFGCLYQGLSGPYQEDYSFILYMLDMSHSLRCANGSFNSVTSLQVKRNEYCLEVLSGNKN